MPVAMQRGAVVAKRYLKPLSFHSTNGGMPEHLARSAMVMQCYQELVPVMGLTLYAGDFNCAAGQAPPSHAHAHAHAHARDAHAHAHACAAHACADSTRSIHCALCTPTTLTTRWLANVGILWGCTSPTSLGVSRSMMKAWDGRVSPRSSTSTCWTRATTRRAWPLSMRRGVSTCSWCLWI